MMRRPPTRKEFDMNELLNKTTEELTVKDQLIICAAVPIITIGGIVVAGVALSVADKTRRIVKKKFRKSEISTPEVP
jgi:hypothetical protein